MLTRMKVIPFGFVSHDARAFDDSQYLVGGMNVWPSARSVFEEDGNNLEFFALVASHKVMHVNRPLKVLGIGGPRLGLVGLREFHLIELN
jgi:hypothetical protein